MKVGDYVRTKREIIKVSRIYERADGNMVFDDEKGLQWYFIEIKKTSPNIIDLIEVGDIINFGYVYTQTKEVKNIKVHRIKNEADLTLQKFYFNNEKRVLKSIVTKEQFESMEYKIGE